MTQLVKIEINPIFRKNANFEKHGCSHGYVMGLSALAGKIGIVFETSKPKIVWWQFLFWKTLSALETIYSYQAVTSDNTCICVRKE